MHAALGDGVLKRLVGRLKSTAVRAFSWAMMMLPF
jgi:hypothetical protein